MGSKKKARSLLFLYIRSNLEGLTHFGKDDLLEIATEIQSTRQNKRHGLPFGPQVTTFITLKRKKSEKNKELESHYQKSAYKGSAKKPTGLKVKSPGASVS